MRNHRCIGKTWSLLFLLIGICAAAQSPRTPLNAVPASRLDHLRRGINLTQWFAQVEDSRGYTKEHFQNWTRDEDLELIKNLGFEYVRLSVNPQPMFTSGHANDIPTEYLGYLDAAVKMILNHGLAVMIDIQPESDFKAQLKEDAFVEKFADFWRALAQHYSSQDAERVFFEILNEPELSDRYRWYGIQTKVASAIREAAPQHTIIAAGAEWSSDDELIFLEPLRDGNVIYAFHFYSPYLFTHQGATWGVYYWHWVKGLSYPSNRESALKAASEVPEASDRLDVIRYGYEHWDAARIDAEITQVADWAREHSVSVVCNEFGVYRTYADPRDRARWIKDVRESLERHKIGWAMWDYAASFGLVTKKEGKAVPDEAMVKALGLKTP